MRRLAILCFVLLASTLRLEAVQWSVYAGADGGPGAMDATGTAARFYNPTALAVDAQGNAYVVDRANFTIRKVTPDGVVTTLAGLAGTSGHVDATGAAARFDSPKAIALLPNGSLVVSDQSYLRVVAPNGAVSTLAGSEISGYVDGPAAQATFTDVTAFAVDTTGNIYLIDGNAVRVLTVGGQVMTLAGSPTVEGDVDDQGTAARFGSNIFGLTLGPDGNLYVPDNTNEKIRQVTPAGAVTTYATGISAGPILADAGGNLYIAAGGLQKVDAAPGHAVTTIVGNNGPGYLDGPAAVAQFDNLFGLAFAADGALLAADYGAHALRKITLAGDVTTLAGKGIAKGSADGTGSAATFDNPRGLGVDGSGNVYVADSNNHTIRKIALGGVVTTLAGQAGVLGNADGMGPAAQFRYVEGLAARVDGTLYVTDDTGRVRVITPMAEVTKLPPAVDFAYGVATAPGGALVLLDPAGSTIRGYSASGVLSTIAGTLGVTGSADGTGTAATFNSPLSVGVDAGGSIYVADSNNSLIRKITVPGNVVTKLAGGNIRFTDGVGAAAGFGYPQGLAVDGVGNVYVADTDNHAIRKVTPTGRVTTLGGNGTPGSAPGIGSAARLTNPRNIAVGADGTLYVTDDSHRVVQGVDDSTEPPLFTAPAANSVASSSGMTVSYELTEAALSGSVTVKFQPASGNAVTLTLTDAYATQGTHTFSFVTLAPVGSAPSAIASISGGTSLPDGFYTVTLSYRDAHSNPAATAVATNVKIDTVTQTPTFGAPAIQTILSTAISISGFIFTLPEAALAGSVKLTLDDGVNAPHVLALGTVAESAGLHVVRFNPAALPFVGLSTAVSVSGSPVPDGAYTATLSYQDLLGNPVATSVPRTGVIVDTVTQTSGFTLNTPAASAAIGSPVTAKFTLPEAAGVVLLSFSNNNNSVDLNIDPALVNVGTETTVTFDPNDPVNTSNGAIVLGGTIPDGVYTVKLAYRDAGLNAQATLTHINVRIDTTAPAFNLPENGLPIQRAAAGTLPDYTGLLTTTDASTVTVTQSPLTSSVTTYTGQPITVTLTATDAAGNTTTQDITVEVRPADPINTVVITASTKAAIPGGPVPGAGVFNGLPAGATFTSLGVPAIDNLGNLAFTGKWVGPNKTKGSGIFTDTKCIALVGGAAPGGGTYKTLSDPVAANGSVAFIATLTGVPAPQKTAILSDAPTGILENIAQTGIDANIGGATFKAFKGVQILGNIVGFYAQVTGGSGADKITAANDFGLWIKSGPDPLEVSLREGDVVDQNSDPVKKVKTLTSFAVGAGSPGQGRGWLGDPYDVVMLAHTLLDDKAKTQAVIGAGRGGNYSVYSQSGSTAFGAPTLTDATFQTYGFPAANMGSNSYGLTFLATLTPSTPATVTKANNKGVFFTPQIFNTPTLDALVRLTDSVTDANGATATIVALKDPVLAEDGGVAYAATLKGSAIKAAAANTLWWKPAGESTAGILAQGGHVASNGPQYLGVPGVGSEAQFKTFNSLAIAASRGPIFTATLATGKTGGNVTPAQANGVWAVDFEGKIRQLFQTGTTPDGTHTLKSFTVLTAVPGSIGVTRSFNDNAQLTWLATFTDGTTAIVKTVIP